MTLKIKFAKAPECKFNNTYSPMRLNYNVKAFTSYKNMKYNILQGGGYSLPIDLISKNIKVIFTFLTATAKEKLQDLTQ